MRRTLRTLPLLAALLAVAITAAPAAADGGSAACTVPFEMARTQPLGSIFLQPGPYKVTVMDTSEITCDEANDQLREVLREPGAAIPGGWKLDEGTRTLSRADGTDAFRFDADTPVGGGSQDLEAIPEAFEELAPIAALVLPGGGQDTLDHRIRVVVALSQTGVCNLTSDTAHETGGEIAVLRGRRRTFSCCHDQCSVNVASRAVT